MEQSMNLFLFIIYLYLILSLYFIIKPECEETLRWALFTYHTSTNFLPNKRFSTFEPNGFEHDEKQYDYKIIPGCCMCKPLPLPIIL